MDQRNTFRAAHRSYVIGNDQPIMLAGAFLDGIDQCGSLYIFEAQDEEQVRQWLEKEPFVRNGIYRDLFIRRFEPGLSRMALHEWPIGGKSPDGKG
jgi:uncharacterized protein YciI